jgi:hypothetical protein
MSIGACIMKIPLLASWSKRGDLIDLHHTDQIHTEQALLNNKMYR